MENIKRNRSAVVVTFKLIDNPLPPLTGGVCGIYNRYPVTYDKSEAT
jgi:hypothetical protein